MKNDKTIGFPTTALAIAAAALLLLSAGITNAQESARKQPVSITTISSTVPSNGDINPYGIFAVPKTVGHLTKGNILISNFNASSNLQGTGTTIVQISPTGNFSVFAQIDPTTLPGSCPGGVGLTTGLVVLRSGWVIVGSLPTSDGMSDTAQAGCLIVLDSNGNVVETITDPQINGPWDMTVYDRSGQNGDHPSDATLFVTNVLNGTVAGNGSIVNEGTVLRIVLSVPQSSPPTVESIFAIGTTFPERTDPAALVIGPTGVALSSNNKLLYVADSLNNRIAAINNPLTRSTSAGIGSTFISGGGLNDPLGLALAANGDILAANGNDGNMVRIRPNGTQKETVLLDPAGAGVLFGLIDVHGQGVYFVDDGTNTLDRLP